MLQALDDSIDAARSDPCCLMTQLTIPERQDLGSTTFIVMLSDLSIPEVPHVLNSRTLVP